MKQLIGYFDGACEPRNPGGNMGVGACIFCDGWQLFKFSDFIPAKTSNSNNVAEYMGFRALLRWIRDNYDPKTHSNTVQIWGDSKLVIMQMRGEWKMKGGHYIPTATECKKMIRDLKEIQGVSLVINWHRRELNSYADELSKAELVNNNVEFKLQPLTP